MEELPFFVYDHEALVEEGDDLIDAIMFYHPKATPLNSQCALCGQLMGMVRCLEVISGAAPSVYHLQKCKIAVRHTGRFTLALGASADLPNAAVLKQMDSLYRIFAFYHGSLDAVFKRCGEEKQPFLLAMERIWECYLPYIKHYSRVVPAMFDVIPSVPLPKSAGVLFLRASHILQSCQRKPGVLAGCLLYDNKVLCTQLSPELTSRLLLIKANQSNHPANEVETDFSLPFGVRILSVYLTKKESRSFSNHSQKLFPTRQRHTAVSSFQSPGGGGRRVNRTASEESARSLSLRGVGDGRESDGQISREQSFITPPFRLTDSFIDKEDKQSSTTSNESLVETLSTETVLSADKGTDSALSGPLQADGGTSSASSRRDSSQSGNSVKSCGNIGALDSYEGEISMSSTELADEREHGGIDEDSSVLVMKVEDHDLPVAQLGNGRSNDAQVRSPDVQLPKVLPTEEIQSSRSSKKVLSDAEHGRANSTEESEQPSVSQKRSESLGLEKDSNSLKGNTEKMSASESGHIASKEDKPQELLPDQPHSSLDDVSNTGAQEQDATSGKPTDVCSEESDSLKASHLENSNQDGSNQKSQYNDHSNGVTDIAPKLEKCNLTDSNEVPDDIIPVDENDDDSKRTEVVSEPVLLQNAGGMDTSSEHTDTAKNDANSSVENTSEDLHESEELCMEGLDDVSRLKHAVSSQHTDANTSQSSKSTYERICNGRLEAGGIASQKTLTETANTTATSNDEAASELRETEVTPTLPELTPENQNGGVVMEQAASEVIGSSEFNDPSIVDSLNTSHTSVPKSSISDQQLTSTVTVEDDLQEGCQDASDTLEGEDKDAEDLRRKKTSCADSKLPGLLNAGLYIQGHSHMVLLMLIERNCQNDLPTMQGLWKTSVTQMGDLEGQLKEVVFSTNSGAAEEGYNFLHFDGFDRLLKGNLQEPVLAPDVQFCNTSQFIHQEFQQSDTLNDVLVRSQSAGVYGSRSLSQETFFQLRGLGRGGQQGVPSPHDPLFNLENRARKKLLKDHHITFF
ncbi:serine-rich adhesin for platelets-like [Branchiostoma floridae]|uniref:Serine-rich adhesin for platelets-like n=1 Tax=Branchiostoma floridae TaxID=7739 RepID=A0A9J7M100_BRAFL|nr:serine-rich adhesin for platelets-like [Branchiostoma floridae]